VYTITLLPEGRKISAQPGENLLECLRVAGVPVDAPCGGHGKCGKCTVMVNGEKRLACQYTVNEDLTVQPEKTGRQQILTAHTVASGMSDGADPFVLAYDIGTTTVVCYLLSGETGALLSRASALNPQIPYGADVISRLQYVKDSDAAPLRDGIREVMGQLAEQCVREKGIALSEVTLACVVGNCAMHHLFLDLETAPLTHIPYMPSEKAPIETLCDGILPLAPGTKLRVLPNIAGFVGADTVACMVSTRLDQVEELTLLIDIGTNGEMVLASPNRRIACSTAAGPAFEGARISCGMRGTDGAVDHVFVTDAGISCHTIGDTTAVGLCGSGLLDLVAVLLDEEIIIPSGKMLDKSYTIPGTEVTLTQKDVREVQLAKAAIRSGIELMTEAMGTEVSQIQKVYLAGAFGNYLDPKSACRIGMIPPVLQDRIIPVGNAAGAGAVSCALSAEEFAYAARLAEETDFLELASLPNFQDCYMESLLFEEELL